MDPESPVLYTVRQDAQGNLQVELSDEGLLQRLQSAAGLASPDPHGIRSHDRDFFLAHRDPDGMYRVSLTEDGMRAFETALGLADDLGRHSRISSSSTIADLMDRAKVREELSEVSRRGGTSAAHQWRLRILQARYHGSQEPGNEAKSISHVLKSVLVGLAGLWTIHQFGIAISDIQDIPGIVANIPSDVLHLDPGHAVTAVHDKITDAGSHVLWGAEGALGTYVLAKIIRPFGRIYRNDQLVPGTRPVLRACTGLLRRPER